MDIIQHSDLKFELQAFRPGISSEMYEWFLDNSILYETREDRYGDGSFHYLFYIWFETLEDAVAFKLRWI